MLTAVMPDIVTIVATPPVSIPGRLEQLRTRLMDPTIGSGGSSPGASHIGYLAPAVVNADGSTSATALPPDAYLTDQAGAMYVGLGAARQARTRAGLVDHLEVVLRVLTDPISVYRAAGTADSEGNPDAVMALVLTGMGAWGEATAHDELAAQQRHQIVDSAVLLPTGYDVRLGDQVTVRRGTAVVVSVEDAIYHQRALLRQLAR